MEGQEEEQETSQKHFFYLTEKLNESEINFFFSLYLRHLEKICENNFFFNDNKCKKKNIYAGQRQTHQRWAVSYLKHCCGSFEVN